MCQKCERLSVCSGPPDLTWFVCVFVLSGGFDLSVNTVKTIHWHKLTNHM